MKTKIAGLFLISMLVLSLSASADPPDLPKLEEKFFDKIEFLFKHQEDLALTDEQIQAIMSKKFEIKRLAIETYAQKDLALIDIYKELHSDNPRANEMHRLVDKKMDAAKAYSHALVDALLHLKNLLNPGQRSKAQHLYLKERFASGRPELPRFALPAPPELPELPPGAPPISKPQD